MKIPAIVSALWLAFAAPAQAATPHQAQDAAEERIQHYMAEKPATADEAIALIESKIVVVGNALGQKNLDNNGFEAIHEASYSLELAVDHLRESQTDGNQAALDALDEAVQALHYASEHHKEALTREWFSKLQDATKALRQL